VIWQFRPQGLGFESNSLVCCVGCIWDLSVVRPFHFLKAICQSCSRLCDGKCVLAGGPGGGVRFVC